MSTNGEAGRADVMGYRMKTWSWIVALALLGAAGCGGDDDDDDDDDDIGGEGEGEADATLDILVDAAEGVLNGARSARAYYLVSGSTSCDGLTSRRVTPSQFENRREPELDPWDGLGHPHVIAEIANGASQILIEVYTTADGTGDPSAAGCEDPVYVAPGDNATTAIQVRLNP